MKVIPLLGVIVVCAALTFAGVVWACLHWVL